jgi:plastocyanin
VTARRIEEAGGDASDRSYESRKFKFAEKVNYAEMTDFIVYIDQPLAQKPSAPNREAEVVTQKDATFRPHVLPVLVGTTVKWPNNDDIFHNVFSISDSKQFDLGLYKSPPKAVTFDKPGRVDVFCSIHKDMHCIVLVLESPYFTATNGKGRYAITNVPPGVYRLKAWHDRMPSAAKEVTVPETGDVKMDFVLGFPNGAAAK